MKKTVYLYKSEELKREDHSLVFLHGLNRTYIPIEQIDIIIVFSEMNVNKRVLSLLNEFRITILFYNFRGNYIGRFTPKIFYDGKCLVNQVLYYQNQELRLALAKEILEASIKNSIALLKYYAKKGRNLEAKIVLLEREVSTFKEMKSIEELLLLEAKMKQMYYSCFDFIIMDKEYKFEKRSMYPPKNKVNAMMSYGYALLYATILGIIDRSKLYSQISFIHSLSKESDSLQYDLADIFKSIYIDRLIIRLIRKRQLKDTYFDLTEHSCYLSKEGVSMFVKEFDALMQKSILVNGKYYTYKNLLSKEVHKLSSYIKGDKKTYHSFLMKY